MNRRGFLASLFALAAIVVGHKEARPLVVKPKPMQFGTVRGVPVQMFDSAGTWVAPKGLSIIYVECWGGGGGGRCF